MFASFSFFGLFDFYLINVFLFLAAFLGAFVFWRRLHLNGNYKEFEVFDLFLLALFYGFCGGRLAFIFLHWPLFGWHLLSWLNIFAYPGLSLIFALLVAGLSLYFMLKQQKLNRLEIMDYWAQATCFGLIFYQLGNFFAGDGLGYATSSFLGLYFPHLEIKVLPAQLYNLVFFLFLYLWLNHSEKNYRTYIWYRGSRSTADPGFLLFIFLIFSGLYSLVSLSFTPAQYFIGNFSFDWIIYLLVSLWGLILLTKHASFFPFYGNKRK